MESGGSRRRVRGRSSSRVSSSSQETTPIEGETSSPRADGLFKGISECLGGIQRELPIVEDKIQNKLENNSLLMDQLKDMKSTMLNQLQDLKSMMLKMDTKLGNIAAQTYNKTCFLYEKLKTLSNKEGKTYEAFPDTVLSFATFSHQDVLNFARFYDIDVPADCDPQQLKKLVAEFIGIKQK